MNRVVKSSEQKRHKRRAKAASRRYRVDGDSFNYWYTNSLIVAHLMYYFQRVFSFLEDDVVIVDMKAADTVGS